MSEHVEAPPKRGMLGPCKHEHSHKLLLRLLTGFSRKNKLWPYASQEQFDCSTGTSAVSEKILTQLTNQTWSYLANAPAVQLVTGIMNDSLLKKNVGFH
jgi:hypothetical protein